MSNEVSEDIVVAASPDEIMEVIADFEAYPEWQPEFQDVEILETDEDGWGTRVRYVIDAGIFKAKIVLDYTYTENEMRWELVEGEHVRKDDGVYRLEQLGNGTTRVTYEIELEPGVPVPGVLRRKASQRIVHGALAGLKERIETRA